MESISNRKPDSMKAGRNPEKSAICAARNWLRASDEIRRPCPSAGTMNTADSTSSAGSEPRSGTWKTKIASPAAARVESMPSTK